MSACDSFRTEVLSSSDGTDGQLTSGGCLDANVHVMEDPLRQGEYFSFRARKEREKAGEKMLLVGLGYVKAQL